MTDPDKGLAGRAARPAVACAVLAAALCGCGEREPAADAAPFVEGLSRVGLSDVRHEGFRRDAGGFVMTGVTARAASGEPVAAREVRFEEVLAMRPLAAERVVVTDLRRGADKAGRVELRRLRADAHPFVDPSVTAERVEGRLAGLPYAAERMVREPLPGAVPGVRVRFTGLRSDAPGLRSAPSWEGGVDLASAGPNGSSRIAFVAESGAARLGVQAEAAGMPPGAAEAVAGAWPLVDADIGWRQAAVRRLTLRAEGLAADEAFAKAAGAGPAGEVARGLAKGEPVAVAYDAGNPLPLGVAWDAFTAGNPLQGLFVRVGERDVPVR